MAAALLTVLGLSYSSDFGFDETILLFSHKIDAKKTFKSIKNIIYEKLNDYKIRCSFAFISYSFLKKSMQIWYFVNILFMNYGSKK